MQKKIVNKKISARSAAVEVLQQVFGEEAYTNIAVNKYLRQHQLEEQERKFFTELVYGTVKAVGTIDWYLQQCISRPLTKVDCKVLDILRISVFQLLYLDRIPASAACNEAVKLARIFSHEGSAKFVNGVLRGLLRKVNEIKLPDAEKETADWLAVKYLHPRWLVKKWLKQFGKDDTIKLCEFNNSAAPVCLRVNTLKTDRGSLLSRLTEMGVEAKPSKWSKDGIICEKISSLNTLFASYGSEFYVQDESSMLVAHVLAPELGQTVIDMCSAPGGKTTHIAQLMENKGQIIAGDIHEHKIRLIQENAERLGIDIISASVHDATVLEEGLVKTADRVLVDAPCSGLGVLRRRAEARWRKKKSDLKMFPPLQLKILTNAAQYVKEDGLLVYSTCTIESAENHYVIEEFLQNNKEWEYAGLNHPLTGETINELQLLPQADGTDGFYICALKRKNKV